MPIFRPHFTLALNEHLPQRIEDHIPSLLHISESLSPKYAVFFNGAKAGASAPDHMHFQCCLAEDLLPKTFFASKPASLIAQCSLYSYVGHEYLALFGTNPKEIESTLRTLLGKFNPELFNLACLKREQAWEIVFIPRAQHRPSCYTADPGLLISPGTVELLGNLITVRESDFLGLNAEAIVQIFEEVLLPNSKVEDARKWLESSQK